MIERAREVLAGITTVIEMVAASRMRSVAGRCWKRWSGQLAAFAPSAGTRDRSLLLDAILVGERAPASINAPIESVGFSSP